MLLTEADCELKLTVTPYFYFTFLLDIRESLIIEKNNKILYENKKVDLDPRAPLKLRVSLGLSK